MLPLPFSLLTYLFPDYAEDEAREWLRSLTGEDVEGDFSVALKDGKVICKALNAIKSGTIQRINHSQMPFKQVASTSGGLVFLLPILIIEAYPCLCIFTLDGKYLFLPEGLSHFRGG